MFVRRSLAVLAVLALVAAATPPPARAAPLVALQSSPVALTVTVAPALARLEVSLYRFAACDRALEQSSARAIAPAGAVAIEGTAVNTGSGRLRENRCARLISTPRSRSGPTPTTERITGFG